jgi:REP element-mobilizing transposase RayT
MAKGQLELELPTWGGKRKGAGRKPRGARAGVSHGVRAALARSKPVHITLRTVPDVGRLRTRDAYRVVRQAMVTSFGTSRSKGRCRICHMSIQGNHLHLLVEADDRDALSRGIQGFEVSCAKRMNAEISRRTGKKRRGKVFSDRYHARVLNTPGEVRSCIAYVLNNWRRHNERDHRRSARDAFATGWHFDGWDEDLPVTACNQAAEILPVWFPTVWLLKTGWRRHGPISPWAVPGPHVTTGHA